MDLGQNTGLEILLAQSQDIFLTHVLSLSVLAQPTSMKHRGYNFAISSQ